MLIIDEFLRAVCVWPQGRRAAIANAIEAHLKLFTPT